MGKLRVHVKKHRVKSHMRTTPSGKRVRIKSHMRGPFTYKREDIGAQGRGKDVIGKVEEGELKEHGYSLNKSASARHKALRKDVKEHDPTSTFRRVNAIYVWNKRQNKSAAKKAQADKRWLKKKYKIGE